MNILKRNIIVALLCMACASGLGAQEINPLTQAMLDGYEQILQKDPNDWFTLYQRSAQYYRLSRYDLALNDIKKAISCTPAKEKDMLATEYQLAADIYIQTEEYPQALEAVNSALSLVPDSYPLLYLKGNICLHLNNADEAKACFSKMQRLQSRSQESYVGLARVAIMQGDATAARSLMDEAEKMDLTSPITYCRLGDLCVDLKDYDKAAAHYLSAFGLSTDAERPMSSLFSLAEKDYQAVENAIDYALTKTDNKVPLYFMKGNISMQNGKLENAYTAFQKLLQLPDGQTAEIYTSQAEVCHNLSNQPEAMDAVSKATMLNANPRNLTLKSRIERAMDKKEESLTDALMAVNMDRGNVPANIELAYAYIANDNAQEALNVLNDLIDVAPDNAEALMLRAYVNIRLLSNPSAAVGDYMRVSRITPADMQGNALKALAQTLNGKKLDGDDTIAKFAEANSSNPEALYWVAVYYAQTGDLEKAVDSLARAQQLGYENDFNLWDNKDANFNVDPIRYLMKGN